MNREIKIVDYRPEHQPYFESFNRAWIEKLFTMEPVDEFVLTDPDEAILKSGGAILMAEYNGKVAGTVGLRKVDAFTYEFTKMAVDENFRRLGIAEAISYASFKKAKQLGARQVILYSNKLNAEAIKLYEKIGFKHVEVEPGVYKRANVKMVIDIETAVRTAQIYDNLIQSKNIKIIQADVSHAAIIATIGKKSFRNAFEGLFNNREELFEYLELTYDPVKLIKSIKKENNFYLLAYSSGTGPVKMINLYSSEIFIPNFASLAYIKGRMYKDAPACLGIQALSSSTNFERPSAKISFGGAAMHILSSDLTKRS